MTKSSGKLLNAEMPPLLELEPEPELELEAELPDPEPEPPELDELELLLFPPPELPPPEQAASRARMKDAETRAKPWLG